MPDKKITRTKSGGTKPAAGKPATGKPAASKAAGAKATSTKPAGRKPAATKAAATKATAGKSAAPKPVAGKTAERKPAAAKAASAQSAAPAAAGTPAAAEANPLHRRLRLRSEDKGLVVAPPPDAENPLLPLPESFVVVEQPSELATHKGPFDYIHVFARDRVELTETLSLLSQGLAPTGSLWVSWMKPRSKLKGGGQPGDLNESIVRRIGLTRGFVDMNLAALDRDWGALRLVRRK